MDWFKALDEYCERLGPDFWSEPVNAISNLSFIIGSILAFKLRSKLSRSYASHYFLSAILFAVGVGSFLYHTFANLWSMFADILPIYIFQLSLIVIYGCAIARNKCRPQYLGGAFLLAAFILLTLLFSQFPREYLNGSIAYFSAFLSLLFIGIYQRATFSEERNTLLTAALMFAVALLFRTIDRDICDSMGLGTHFMWHLINGGVLYLSIRAYVGVLVHEEKHSKLGM